VCKVEIDCTTLYNLMMSGQAWIHEGELTAAQREILNGSVQIAFGLLLKSDAPRISVVGDDDVRTVHFRGHAES
jgi:hypothetical protein